MKSISSRFVSVRFTVLVLLFVLLTPGIVFSQASVSKQVLESSQKALADYITHFIRKDNLKSFGFESIEGSRAARLGNPYPVMIIGLRDLTEYKAGTSTRLLLIDSKTLWFPVNVEGRPRTKLEMVEKEGKWIPGEFGGTKTVEPVTMGLNQLPKLMESKGIHPPYRIMLVKIPALYATFLYREGPEGEFLIPTMVQPERFDLMNSQIYNSEEVLSKLREYAKRIDPDKVM